ncbi:MAG: sensor histidine kinase [Anaerolineae bacterium]
MSKVHAKPGGPFGARSWLLLGAALLGTGPALLFLAAAPRLLAGAPWHLVGMAILAGLLLLAQASRYRRLSAGLERELAAERQHRTMLEASHRQALRLAEARLAHETRDRDILVRTEKLASLSRLVAGLAHELNNPLTAILGHATLLQARLGDGEKGLQVIAEQAQRCAALVRDLQAFAAHEQSAPQVLDLQALVESALHEATMDRPACNLQVQRVQEAARIHVRGRMDALQQALVQVIDNACRAVDHRPNARLQLRIARGAHGRVRIEVTDNGPGIEPEALAHIFDPFFFRRAEGEGLRVGLGLSVALGLVQAQGGRIWAESRMGEGTTVTIELPAA